jgi:dTMP kinase
MSRGRLIVLEGIDGSGTTTQVGLLAQRYRELGHGVVSTCEPSRGPIGKLIRQTLQGRLLDQERLEPHAFGWATMALLFAADRMDHVATEIQPALDRGDIVLSDRYDLSSLAYQSATAPEDAHAVPWIRRLNERVVRPALTIVLDLEPELAEARRRARGEARELFEDQELQRRLALAYARAEELVPGDTVVHVPGAGTKEEVAERAWAIVTQVTSER